MLRFGQLISLPWAKRSIELTPWLTATTWTSWTGSASQTCCSELDFVAALRRRTKKILDVHLMLTNTDAWISRYAEAGSNLLTVHRRFCQDVAVTLNQIRSSGARPGLVVELGIGFRLRSFHLDLVDRLLVMGTEIGIKGKGLHPSTPQRIASILELCAQAGRRPEIVVDGGIRRETVPLLAQAGADGVVPGSLVFGEPDPCAALHWIREQRLKTSDKA